MRYLRHHNGQSIRSNDALDAFLNDIAGLTTANDDILQKKSGAWTNRTLSQFKTDLGIAAPAASSGTVIAFDVPRTYGYSAAETGNVTLNATGLIEGMTQLLIHNHSSEPTFPATMKVVGGAYVTSVDNYIVLYAVKADLILVTISQEV